jgi:(1->4)-alpha-D-glucan 1-alpha-D-glucosylmutase
VDFKIRSRLLDELLRHETEGLPSLVRDLLSNWEDGRIKLYTTYRALNARKSYRDLFLNGDYVPVQVHGEKKEHICAFTRSKGDCWALVAVPRLLTKLVSVNQLPVGQDVWGNEHITLPEGAPGHWRNIFTGERVTLTSPAGALPVSQVIGIFPVALLISDPLPAK